MDSNFNRDDELMRNHNKEYYKHREDRSHFTKDNFTNRKRYRECEKEKKYDYKSDNFNYYLKKRDYESNRDREFEKSDGRERYDQKYYGHYGFNVIIFLFLEIS